MQSFWWLFGRNFKYHEPFIELGHKVFRIEGVNIELTFGKWRTHKFVSYSFTLHFIALENSSAPLVMTHCKKYNSFEMRCFKIRRVYSLLGEVMKYPSSYKNAEYFLQPSERWDVISLFLVPLFQSIRLKRILQQQETNTIQEMLVLCMYKYAKGVARSSDQQFSRNHSFLLCSVFPANCH